MNGRRLPKPLATPLGRRSLLVGATAAASALALRAVPAFAKAAPPTEYFVLVHAAGGWDVTLWADPRYEKKGLVDPATTANLDTRGLVHWKDGPASEASFRPVSPRGSSVELGPAAGELLGVFDRVTLFNGVAMSTVSHPDGAAYAITGRHLVGGRPVASSVDAVLAHAFGAGEMLPAVSIRFPSAYLGAPLDPRAIPVELADVDALGRALVRREHTTWEADRDDVAAVLGAEARRLASRGGRPARAVAMATQYDALARLAREGVDKLVGVAALREAHPSLPWRTRAGSVAAGAAFALEAFRRDLARVVAFSMPGFDTHASNYRTHGLVLQDLFQLVVAMLRAFDALSHPTLAGHKLSDHVHVLVFSEFCRTPQINLNGGRDHYPNNSMLLVSPRVRAGRVVGRTDPSEVLPLSAREFALGARAATPPDVLATLLSAVNVNPAPHIRDGEVMEELVLR